MTDERKPSKKLQNIRFAEVEQVLPFDKTEPSGLVATDKEPFAIQAMERCSKIIRYY
jgi:hypothetical protein